MRLGVRLDVRKDLLHIVARREICSGSSQDDKTYFSGLARNCLDVVVQRLEHGLRKSVQLLRSINCQSGSATTIFSPNQTVHSEAPPSDSTIRRPTPEIVPPCRHSGWPRPEPMPVPLVDTPAL